MSKYVRSEVPEEFAEDEPQMTPAQKQYLLDLINSRVMATEKRQEAFARIGAGLTKKQASACIDKALELPKQNSEFNHRIKSMPKVPPGRYAVMICETVAGVDVETLKFFKVKMPTEGRWAGFTFLDAGRGGSYNDLQWTSVRDVEYKTRVLKKIAENPQEAGKKFGQEIGACCRCGRSLTDATSRSLGIGPDCRQKGW